MKNGQVFLKSFMELGLHLERYRTVLRAEAEYFRSEERADVSSIGQGGRQGDKAGA